MKCILALVLSLLMVGSEFSELKKVLLPAPGRVSLRCSCYGSAVSESCFRKLCFQVKGAKFSVQRILLNRNDAMQ